MQTPDWIAVDWGTSNMRAWAMSASGTVLAEVRSDKGMGDLTPDQFEDAFRDATNGWDINVPIVACGMVGARDVGMEATDAAVHCPAARTGVTQPRSTLTVHHVSGVIL